ncbi:hypothetical protein TEHD23766T_0075 [Tetragenococcus halophilus subsp. flandriensis]|nr:hypothetical protein TEHD23766T_0075 [Tetragenococcus halophilus subsp. flandriensis]
MPNKEKKHNQIDFVYRLENVFITCSMIQTIITTNKFLSFIYIEIVSGVFLVKICYPIHVSN